MSFWKSIGDFLRNPVVRGVSAAAGAAGAAGAFDGFEWGDTLTKVAGAANLATGTASAMDGNQSGLSRALGVGQIGLGGFNVLQGGVELPFGGGKVGGFGSVSSWLGGGDSATNSATVSGGGWSTGQEDEAGRLIFSEPLAPLPGAINEMPSNARPEIYGLGGGMRTDVPNQFASAAAPELPAAPTMAPRLPAPPEMGPGRPTQFGNGQLTDFETITGQSSGSISGQTTGRMEPFGSTPQPSAAPMPPPPAPPVAASGVGANGDRMIAQLPNGVRMIRPDGTTYIQADKSSLTFFQRLANVATDDPMKALSATAAVGGMLSSLFQPSVADIYKEMAAKYDPDSANAQQFRADFKARAEREAKKQHAQLSSQLRVTMADRGMLDSTVYATAQAELDKGLVETTANLDWNSWQAWNQYARSMGATQIQSAQSASLLAGNQQGFANVSRMLARTV